MANSSQTILVTGATGSNGIEILKLLAALNIRDWCRGGDW
jgi:FlaA1/EpsC-like NDP-sugar epimerase